MEIRQWKESVLLLKKDFAVHHEELGVRFRIHRDAATAAGEDGQVAFACFTLAIHDDFPAQHEERSCVSVG